jgi:DUF4097 and DUF4098 domain-containing protein YvlB
MKQTILMLLLASGTALAATEEQINKTFPASPGGKLVVDVSFGSIDVTTNSRAGEIAVDVWRKITRKDKAQEEQFLRDHPVEFLPEGDTLTIRCRIKQKNQWTGRNNRNEGKYTIHVPAQFSAKLDTSGGAIAVSDLTGEVNADTSGGALRFMRINGPLNGDTSGGSIHVTDCRGTIKVDTSGGRIEVSGGGGSLDGDTSGGDVTVKDFAGPASVETSGGGITMENVRGTVKGETSGGSIHAVLLSPIPGPVTLSTSGGGVTVKVAPEAAFNLDADTSGGGVSCDLPVTMEGKKERNRLNGTVNGGGPSVSLHSSGGGIQVKRLQ